MENEEVFARGRLPVTGLVRWMPGVSKIQMPLWSCGGNLASKLMQVVYIHVEEQHSTSCGETPNFRDLMMAQHWAETCRLYIKDFTT
jgi:hypothetical protein